MLRTACLALMLTTAPAAADVAVSFSESAPKDLFTIRNTSTCPTGSLRVTIDLSGSAAGLIFDTTGSGAGVSVFQPLELAAGQDHVTAISRITDGDQAVVIDIADLPGRGSVVFTTDVDDTRSNSAEGPTMISGTEIAGARLLVEAGGGPPVTAAFGTQGKATVPWEACLS